VSGDPRPTHGVDVTGEPLQRGIASLEAHAQYLAGIPGHPAPRLMITGLTALQGRGMGVPNAVLFRAWDFQAPPPIAAEAMAAAAQAQDLRDEYGPLARDVRLGPDGLDLGQGPGVRLDRDGARVDLVHQ